MISIDEHPPPDPSSSDYQNQQQQQVSHEALASVSDIDLLKPKDANLDFTNYPLSNFSIRDYVFGLRCKDIARNWPFSGKSLQLCLNYRVDDFLPPFESLDSQRSNKSDRFISVTCSSIKSQCHLEEDLAHTKSNSQPTVKKCKLVMKLNSGVEPIDQEAVASKVCPVCKTFSSSSNTTLNAHIDQCLYEESNMKLTANPKIKRVKHRIKPRKTRLMVDIYKTAPHCTVEELDRRNATSWATNSTFPDQELEFQAEEKNEEPQDPSFIPEVADHEGAVYIDSNGTKVRILSMPKFNKLDDDNAPKLQKGGKGSKFVRDDKKKKKAYSQKNRQKFLKLSPNCKKFSKKVTSCQQEHVTMKESCKKENGGKKPMKDQVNKQMDSLTITRPPWACSKRTGVAKKRFPVLTKPKDQGTRLSDDSPEDPSVSMSKGCKFSSLKKNLLKTLIREHNVGSKINLKRKFSALKKSQDLRTQNSRMEEDTGDKLYFGNVNVMKAKKKSITSKTSNQNEDTSSEALEITSASAGIDVPFQSDHVGNDGNFLGLRNSFDDEFSKMVGQQDSKLDSREVTLDDIIMGNNTETQGNYFEKVDQIPIPGPPGSFLPPSPGADMVSEEELQGNSSLTTTSRVQSNEDPRHQDLMKTDFVSDSPVSTVSSPSFARSCDKLSLRFTSQQNKKSVNSGDMRSVDACFTEKDPTPCCCSRKESLSSKNVASYHQKPFLESNKRPETMNFMPKMFSLTLPPPETVKSPVDASVKLPVYKDSESAASPTTPVLRLMGKNLTVVRTDDDDDASLKPPCSRPMGQCQQFQNIQNENHSSFVYGHRPHHNVDYSHDQNLYMHQRFNLHPPNFAGSFSDLRSENMDSSATMKATKEIIFIDDSSENEGDDNRMFKEPMIRNRASSSSSITFGNPYGNGSFQTSSPLREIVNDGNFGRWVNTETSYPFSSIAGIRSAYYRSS